MTTRIFNAGLRPHLPFPPPMAKAGNGSGEVVPTLSPSATVSRIVMAFHVTNTDDGQNICENMYDVYWGVMVKQKKCCSFRDDMFAYFY